MLDVIDLRGAVVTVDAGSAHPSSPGRSSRQARRRTGGWPRHWDVENRLYWTLDVSYGEDASRARSGYLAQNLATVRRLANNVLAAFTKSTPRLKHQMKFALDAKWRSGVGPSLMRKSCAGHAAADPGERPERRARLGGLRS